MRDLISVGLGYHATSKDPRENWLQAHIWQSHLLRINNETDVSLRMEAVVLQSNFFSKGKKDFHCRLWNTALLSRLYYLNFGESSVANEQALIFMLFLDHWKDN